MPRAEAFDRVEFGRSVYRGQSSSCRSTSPIHWTSAMKIPWPRHWTSRGTSCRARWAATTSWRTGPPGPIRGPSSRLRVIEVDSHTGAARNLIDETTQTFIWTTQFRATRGARRRPRGRRRIRPAAIAGLLRAASSRDRTAEPKRGGPSWQLTSPSSVLANLPEPVAPIDVSVIGHDFIDQIV